MGNDAVEREMKICHTQPHLVPPMKLVFYDDLPTSRQRSSSHLSQWVVEGRNIASRASNRASTSIKKRTSRRPQISRPSDFRRVDPPLTRLDAFRPLELSIYLPGNRLSPLRGFDDFDLGDVRRLQSPDRALIVRSRSDTLLSQTSSFQIARKPVASTVSENDLAWSRGHYGHNANDTNDRYTQSRPSFCESISSQDLTAEALPLTRIRPSSEPPHGNHDLRPRATLTEPWIDSFSPILEEETVIGSPNLVRGTGVQLEDRNISPTPSTLDLPLHAPPTPPSPAPPSSTTSSPNRKRVTQWLLRSPSIASPSNSPFYQCSAKSGATNHTRTMSASTASSMASATAPTISSFSTQQFSQFSPRIPTASDKEHESGLIIKEHEMLPPLPPSSDGPCHVVDGDEKGNEGQPLRISAVGLAF